MYAAPLAPHLPAPSPPRAQPCFPTRGMRCFLRPCSPGSPQTDSPARSRRVAVASALAFQEEAFEENQKYKEGKIILEKATISKLRGA